MAGQLTIDTLKASSGVLATQNGMAGIAKAWVNFSGSGSATVNNSFNISSVVRNSSGSYTVNFSNAMPNTNFSAIATGSNNGSAYGAYVVGNEGSLPRTTTSWSFWTGGYGAIADSPIVNVAVFA